MAKRFETGDFVLLVGEDDRQWVTKIGDGHFSTAKGNFPLAELIGEMPGVRLRTQLGYRGYAFTPTPTDIALHAADRKTQITYPKEMGYILVRGGVQAGSAVLEAGTGTGASAIMFAATVGDGGRVFSYERRPEFTEVARRNLERAGLLKRVELKTRDIVEGFDERDMDFIFLDVRNPWSYLTQAAEALVSGGSIMMLVPTTNQVSDTLRGIESGPFVGTEICELMLRTYKTNADRLRPEDRMVAHTAFLLFARKTAN